MSSKKLRKLQNRRKKMRVTFGGAVAAAGVAAMYPGQVIAAPQGAEVVKGQVNIVENGNLTQITASNNAIINYQQFNIGKGETVQFIQPGATARVLNRVTGGDISRIDGSLQANGIVYILNPSGIFFGREAVVDVTGLRAAAGNISNADFLRNVDRFTGVTGDVTNMGTIQGNAISLIGKHVQNVGSIIAPEGMVTMAAGDEVLIGERNGAIMVKLSSDSAAGSAGDKAGVENSGTIDAGKTGRVTLGAGDIYSLAVNQSGTIRGGDVAIAGEGSQVIVSGEINASNDTGNGGSVTVTGDQIALQGAQIDASGRTGGGTVNIGGEFQGGGDTYRATDTTVDAATTIKADALTSGDGGQVVVWSDHATTFHGAISAQAKGATAPGNGGQAEVSGKEFLTITGHADLRAVNGDAGELLLDPGTVSITPLLTASPNLFGADFISAQLGLGDLTISTANADGTLGAQEIININAPISWNSGNTLTLIGGQVINVDNAITNAAGGDLVLMGGSVSVKAQISLTGDLTIEQAGRGTALTLTADNASFLDSATLTIGRLDSTDAVNISSAITTDAPVTIQSGGAVTINSAVQATGASTVDVLGATVNLNAVVTAGGALSVAQADPAGNLVLNSNAAGNLVGSSVAIGDASGTGNVTINNALSVGSGLTVETGGSVIVNGALSSTGAITMRGTLLDVNANVGATGVLVLEQVAPGSALAVDLDAPGRLSGSTVTIGDAGNSGNVTLNSAITTASDTTVQSGGTVTVGGALTSTGAITMRGTTLDINANVDATGALTMSQVGPGSAMTVDVDAAATLDGSTITIGDASNSGNVTLATAITVDDALTAQSGGTLAIDGAITGTSTMTLRGATVDVNAAVNATGALIVEQAAAGVDLNVDLATANLLTGATITIGDAANLGDVNLLTDITANAALTIQSGGSVTTQNIADGGNVVTINVGGLGGATTNSFGTFSGAGSFDVNGGAGADQFTLDLPTSTTSLDGGGDTDTAIVNGSAAADAFSYDAVSGLDINGTQFNPTGVEVLGVNGAAGNDTFTVDFSLGAPGIAGVTFNGGADSDSIVLAGGNHTTTTYNFTNANDGNVNLDGFVVTYTGLEPITNSGTAANVVFNLPTALVNSATLSAAAPGSNLLSGATFEDVTFTNPTTSLVINAGGQGDTITVSGVDGGFGAATIDVVGGAGTDTIVGPNGASTWTISGANSGSVTGTVVFDFSAVENLTGGTANDSFVVTTGTLGGAIAGGGGAGSDSVTGPDAVRTWTLTGSGSGSISDVSGGFTGIESITGGTNNDTFSFNDGVDFAGAISGGAGGTDVLDYAAYTMNISVTLSGANAGSGTGLTTFAAIDTITGGAATGDTLTGADVANTWNVTGSDAGNLTASVSFTAVENLTGGSMNDTFVFSDAAAMSGAISGGSGGTDHLNFAAYTTDISVTLSGANAGSGTGAGSFAAIDTLTGGAATDTLIGTAGADAFTISGADAGSVLGVSFSSVGNLAGAAGNDTFTFTTDTADVVSIDGGADSNSVSFSGRTLAVTIDLQNGTVSGTNLSAAVSNVTSFTGGGAADTLIGTNTASTFNITGADAGDIGGTISFSAIENLTGGTAGDTFDFGAAGSLTGNIDGAAGTDTLAGKDVDTTWTINGTGGGLSNSLTGAFSNVEAFQGGSGDDTFNVIPDAAIALSINGGGQTLGDVIDADLTGVTTPGFAINGAGAGTYSGTNIGAVAYSGIETDNTTGSFAVNVALTADAFDDTYSIVLSGGNLQVTITDTNGGNFVYSKAVADVPDFTVTGSGDNETLSLDFASGAPIPVGGLVFNAGGGTDGITLVDTSGTFVATTITHSFTTNTSGGIDIDGAGITYTGLDPITDNLDAANRVLTFNGGAETITVTGSGADTTFDSTVGESVTFNSPTATLTVNAGGGDDTLDFNSLGTGWVADIILNGDGGTDTVNFNGQIDIGGGDLTVNSENIASILTGDIITSDGSAVFNAGATMNLAGDIIAGAGTVTLNTTAGGVNQTAGQITSSQLILTGTGTFDLDNVAANDVDSLTATTTGDAAFQDSDDLVLNASTITGGLTVTAGGSLSQGGALSVSGAASFTTMGAAGAAPITLNTVTNQFGDVTLTTMDASGTILVANNIQLAEGAAMTVAGINSSGNVTLVTNGNNFAVTLLSDVGATDALASLSISGTDISIQGVGTSGNQTYTSNAGTITLNGDLTSTTGALALNGAVALNSSVALSSGGGAGDNITFTDTVTSVGASVLTVDGGAAGHIEFQGAVTLQGLATAADSFTLSMLGGGTITDAVTFNNTGTITLGDNAADTLTFTGGVTADASAPVTVFGNIVSGSGGGITFGDVTLGGASVINGGGAAVAINSITGGANNLTLSSDNAASDGTVTTGAIANVGVLTLTQASGVTVNGQLTAGTVAISDIEGPGATVGDVTFNGAVGTAGTPVATLTVGGNGQYNVRFNAGTTITDATFGNPGSVAGGQIHFGDGLGGNDVMLFSNGLDTTAVTAGIVLNGTVRTAGTAIDIGAGELGGDSTLDATNNGGVAAGAAVNLTTGDVTGNTFDLTINGGTGGAISLAGATSLTGLGTLNVDGGTINFAGRVAGDVINGDSAGDINIADDAIVATTEVVLNAAGAIVDSAAGSTAANIVGPDVTLIAGTGIGSADAIELDATNLDFINSTSGNVQITDVAGGLTLADLGQAGATHGTLGGGTTTVQANSPLTVAVDMTFTGTTSLTAGNGAADGGDDLTIDGATITLDGGAFTLTGTAGDDIAFANGGNIVSAGGGTHTVALNADADGAADGATGTITQTGATVSITADTVDLNSGNLIGTAIATPLRISAVNITADNTAAGDISLHNTATAATTVSSLTTPAGNVSFTQSGGFNAELGTVSTDTAGAAGVNFIEIIADGGVMQTAADGTDGITGNELKVTGTGTFTLTDADNDVNTLAASVTGPMTVVDVDDLTIATVNGTTGVTASGALSITATGITADEAVSGAGVTLDGRTATVDVNSTLDSGAGALLVIADEINFDGGADSVTGTGTGQFRTTSVNNLNVGGTADNPGELDLTDGDLAALADGFTSITVGVAGGTNDITFDSSAVRDPFIALADGVGGSVVVIGDVTGTGNASFTANAEAIQLAADNSGVPGAVEINVTSGINLTAGAGGIRIGEDQTATLRTIGAASNIVITGALDGSTGDAGTLDETLIAIAPVTGAITAAGPVGLVEPLNISFSAGSVTIPQGNYGAGNPVFEGDTVIFPSIDDSVIGTGTITIRPLTSNRNINIEGTLAGALDITQDDLYDLANGWGLIVIGRANGSGTMEIGTTDVNVNLLGQAGQVRFRDAMRFNMAGVGGQIIVGEATQATTIHGNDDASLTFDGPGATTNLYTDVITQANAVTFSDSVILHNDIVIDTTDGGAFAAGANITFDGTVNGLTAAQQDLNLRGGSAGDILFSGAVGGTTKLGAILIDFTGAATDAANDVTALSNITAASFTLTNGTGSTSLLGNVDVSGIANAAGGVVSITTADDIIVSGSMNTQGGTTAGAGLDGGAVTLSGDTIAVGAITTSGSVAGAGAGGNAGLITLDATGAVDGVQSITLNGNLTAVGGGGNGGSQGAGGDITIGNGADAIAVGPLDLVINTGVTAGNATFDGTFDGGGNAITVTLGAGALSFTGTVDNASSLTVTSASGATFIGAVGAGAGTVGDMTITLGSAAGGNDLTFASTVDVTGQLRVVTANDVTFSGNVTAGNIVQNAGADAGADTTATTAFNGTVTTANNLGVVVATEEISFAMPVTANGGGPVTLTNTGQLTIANGANFDLNGGGAFSQSGGGAVSLGGNITTDGANISFGSGVTLLNSVTLSTNGAGVDVGDITFGGNIAVTTPGADDLTLAAGTGDIVVSGAIGGLGTEADALTIDNAANVNVTGSVFVNSFTQVAGSGTTTLGDDALSDQVVVGGDMTFGTVNDSIANATVDIGNDLVLTSGNDFTFNSTLTVANAATLTAVRDLLVQGLFDVQTGDLTIVAARDITLNGTAASLTVAGDVTIGAARDILVQGTVTATSFTQTDGTGDTTFNDDVTVNEGRGVDDDLAFAIRTSGLLTLGGDVVSADNGNTLGGGDISLTVGDFEFAGAPGVEFITAAQTGGGVDAATITFQPYTQGGSVSVGTGGASFDLSNSDVNALADTYVRVVIGRADGTGTIDVGNAVVFKDQVFFRVPVVGGGTTSTINVLAGGLSTTNTGGTDDASIIFDARTVRLGGDITTQGDDVLIASGGALDFANPANGLGDGATMDDGLAHVIVTGATVIDTTDGGAVADGANITFEHTLDGDGDADNLTLNAGNLGNIQVGTLGETGTGVIGSTGALRLGMLTIVNANDATVEANARVTSFTQTDGQGHTHFKGTLTAANLTTVTAANAIVITDANQLTFDGTVIGGSFTQLAGSDDTTFNGVDDSLLTGGANSFFNNAAGGEVDITTAGDVFVAGRINAGGGTRTVAGDGLSGGAVDITGDTINVASINTSGSNANTAGNGGTAGAIELNATGVLAGTQLITLRGDLTAASGAAAGGGTVGDTDDVTLGDGGETIVLAPDAVATTFIAAADTITITGNDVTFNGTVDSTAGRNVNLTVNTFNDAGEVGDEAGTTTFNGQVGNVDALNNLITDATGLNGRTVINTDFVNAQNLMTFNDAVTIAVDTVLRGNNLGDNTAATTFNRTVNSETGEANDLQIIATLTTFNAQVGNAAGGIFGTLHTTDQGGVEVTTINTDVVNGDIVHFDDPVRIDAVSTTVTGTSLVRFFNMVDSAAGEFNDLNVDTGVGGEIRFGDGAGDFVGSSQALENLTVSTSGNGTIFLSAGAAGADTITTREDQTYNTDVVLAADAVLAGNDVTFEGRLNSDSALTPRSMTVNSVDSTANGLAGVTTFNGTIGAGADVAIGGGDDAALSHLETNANGSTNLGGGLIILDGASGFFGDAVVLTANTTIVELNTGDVTFDSTVNGAFSLTLATLNGADFIFNGQVGGTAALTSIITDDAVTLGAIGAAAANGATIFNGGLVRTTGDQTYNDTVLVGNGGGAGNGSTTFEGDNLAFNFSPNSLEALDNSLDQDVTFHIADSLSFAGDIGSLNDADGYIDDITVSFTGKLVLSGDVLSNGGTITFNGNTTGQIVLMDADGTVVLDSNDDGAGTSGDVNLLDLEVSADSAAPLQTLSIDTSSTDAAGGNVVLGGFNADTVDAMGGFYVNQLVVNTSGSDATAITGNSGSVRLDADVLLDDNVTGTASGIIVTGNGDVVVSKGVAGSTLLIDTEQGDDATGGAVDFNDSNLYADAAGQTLNIVTGSMANTGGNVDLGLVDNNAGAGQFLQHLRIDTANGGTAGVLTLDQDVNVDDDGASAPGSVEVIGTVYVASQVTIDTETGGDAAGGLIDLDQADLSGAIANADLTLDTRAAAGLAGGNVQLGTFSNNGGNYVNDLTILTYSGAAAEGAAALDGVTSTRFNILTDDNGQGVADTGDVTLETNFQLIDTDVTIDTEQDNAGPGGNVTAVNSAISAQAAGLALTIDTSGGAGENGGNVELGAVNAMGGAYLNVLNIDTTGAVSGSTRLNADVMLDDDGVGGASLFQVTGDGDVIVSSATAGSTLLIDTEQGGDASGGAVNLNDSNLYADAAGQDLTIDTSSAAVGGSGGNVDFGLVDDNAGGAAFLNDLLIDTRGDVADGILTLDANVSVDDDGAGDLTSITMQGRVQIAAPGTLVLDTETGDDANGGTADLTDAVVSSTLAGNDLSIDTSNAAAGFSGGNVNLGLFSNDGGAFVNDLTITTAAGTGGTAGSLTLHQNVSLDNAAADAGDLIVTGNGDVVFSADLTIDTEQGDDGSAGDVNFNLSNIFADAAGHDVAIDTSTAAGASAGGDIFLHLVDDSAGAASFINNLTVTNTGATHGTTNLTGGNYTVDQAMTFNGPVVIHADTVMTTNGIDGNTALAAAGNVNFALASSTIDSTAPASGNYSLTVNTGGAGTTTFDGAVGSNTALRALVTNADGFTVIGNNITTDGDHQQYNDAVVLTPVTPDAAITLTHNDRTGANLGIAFNSTLNSGGGVGSTDIDLTVAITGADLDFVGVVGGSNRLGDVNVTAVRDLLQTATGAAAFNAKSLTIATASGDVLFNGQIVTTGVNTGAPGTTSDGGDISITANGFVGLLGGANLNGEAASGGAAGDLTLLADADGRALQANPENERVYRTGAVTDADVLTLDYDNGTAGGDPLDPIDVVILDGSFSALGDGAGADGAVTVNGPGRAVGVPNVATIIGRPAFGSDVIIAADSFTMGQNEKATFFGDLIIDTTAGVGSITVGDLNAFGSITLLVPDDGVGGAQIVVLIRDAGEAVQYNNTPNATDLGVDFVAGDQIIVSERPVRSGASGPEQPIFASPGADHDPSGDGGLLSVYINRDYGAMNEEFFNLTGAAPGMPAGTVLDLSPTPPSNANVSEAIAGAVPTPQQSGDVFRDTAIGVTQQQLVQELGILPRDLTSIEFVWLLANRRFYNDLGGGLGADSRLVANNRLLYRPVEDVLMAFRELFYEQTGDGKLEPKRDQLKGTLQSALDAFKATGATFSPAAFREFIESNPAQADALEIVRGLAELISRVERLGLTTVEVNAVKVRVYGYVMPQGMSTVQMDQLVAGAGLGE